jgi:hypothetical protein
MYKTSWYKTSCQCPYHHCLPIHYSTHHNVSLGSHPLVLGLSLWPSLPSVCRAILLQFTAPGGLPGPLLLLKASSRFWLCGKVGHVRVMCCVFATLVTHSRLQFWTFSSKSSWLLLCLRHLSSLWFRPVRWFPAYICIVTLLNLHQFQRVQTSYSSFKPI